MNPRASRAPRQTPAGPARADRRSSADARSGRAPQRTADPGPGSSRAERDARPRWTAADRRARADRDLRPGRGSRARRTWSSDEPTQPDRAVGQRWSRQDGRSRPDGDRQPAARRDDERPRSTPSPRRADRFDRPRGPRPGAVGQVDRPQAARAPELTGPNAFVDLGVPRVLAALLAGEQIIEPTLIQRLTLPEAIAGRDVLGRGRTGSGKTLAFGLPMLTRLAGSGSAPRTPRGLVLAPTRELAMQVLDVLRPLAHAVGLRSQLVIGGSSYDRQIRGLARADIVVATPGRLVDLIDRGDVALSGVRMAVLDEADHMADLGFLPEIEAIMGGLAADCQVLLFSATLDAEVDRLVRTYLHDPVSHSADPASAAVGTMSHHIVLVHPRDKDAVTVDIALRRGRTLAFVRTQLGADRLAGQLGDEGVRTAALHGGMKQGERTRTLADFRAGRIDVLVATDVAARGIHVDAVDLVVHVDPPHGPKEYLHRSGRTARAGASGTVISLATLRQQRQVSALTGQAGVSAEVLRARPGDPALRVLLAGEQRVS